MKKINFNIDFFFVVKLAIDFKEAYIFLIFKLGNHIFF